MDQGGGSRFYTSPASQLDLLNRQRRCFRLLPKSLLAPVKDSRKLAEAHSAAFAEKSSGHLPASGNKLGGFVFISTPSEVAQRQLTPAAEMRAKIFKLRGN